MFIYLFTVGMLSDAHNQANAASNEAMYSVGYFLCGLAVLATIGILIMAIKLKKINEFNFKKKTNLHL